MRSKQALVAADVRVLLAAARDEAERLGLEVTIAIVDEAGVLLALERLDGARLHTPEAATLKARTAAIVRTPTADLQEPVADNPALLSFPGRMPLTGGVPLVSRGCGRRRHRLLGWRAATGRGGLRRGGRGAGATSEGVDADCRTRRVGLPASASFRPR